MKQERYVTLRNRRLAIPSAATEYVSIARPLLISIMRDWLSQIRFDSHWYVATYADIAEALKSGLLEDAQVHYLEFGYFENRMPYEILIDEEWYLKQYVDVQKAINDATYQSAQEHFVRDGYREGRLPREGFQLELGEDITVEDELNKSPAEFIKRSRRVSAEP